MGVSGSRGVSWALVGLYAILLLARLICCCEDGTYCSKDLGDCVVCPEKPLLDCTGVHEEDVVPCLENCLARPKLATTKPNHDYELPKNTTAKPEQRLTTQERKDVQYKTNNLLVAVGFVVGLLVGIMICIFICQIKSPMREMARKSVNRMYLFVSTYPKSKEETSPVNITDND
ncbi:Hypothetical predicted protein [Paramuricea clavata]|uniref:Uncharacterized protein n=1 Tax=Paramuricea clavata TaxID=317549 RepID=A0A6S7GIU0_PARCT|nr:Hypothetical predicted protein [Paramuricea clavata]